MTTKTYWIATCPKCGGLSKIAEYTSWSYSAGANEGLINDWRKAGLIVSIWTYTPEQVADHQQCTCQKQPQNQPHLPGLES
jgi:steroid 5-alpha reductase family enzyme